MKDGLYYNVPVDADNKLTALSDANKISKPKRENIVRVDTIKEVNLNENY